MPKIQEQHADPLRCYHFHGLDLQPTGSEGQSRADCPFCGGEGKFWVWPSGQWKCWVCPAGSEEKGGGGPYLFMRELWEHSLAATGADDLAELAAERGLLFPDTLTAWGTARSLTGAGDWLVPGFSHDGRLVQLYRRIEQANGKVLLLPTPGLDPKEAGETQRHGLHMPEPREFGGPLHTFWCEGPWDGMALWEVLSRAKRGANGRLEATGDRGQSLLADSRVLAVPGCRTFLGGWASLASGREATLLFDSDHPRRACKACRRSWSTVDHEACPGCGAAEGLEVEPAGWSGAKRAAGILAGGKEPPSEVRWLAWGPAGFDPGRPSGFDVRDWLKGAGKGLQERLGALEAMLARVQGIPDSWLGRRVARVFRASQGRASLEPVPCESWQKLKNAWRKAMTWPEPPDDGLERSFACMLAVVLGTDYGDDAPLWAKVIGPPSSGKSVLCEALATNRRWVYATDTITGLVSGYQTERGEGAKNHSPIERMRGKTLVVKDGDSLMKMPDVAKILSQFRTAYDGAIRTTYGNEMSHDHENLTFSVLICGTETLHFLDESELGERFVDSVVVEKMPEDLEQDIGWRVACRTNRILSGDSVESAQGDSDEMADAKRLTGGYVGFLRENAGKLLGRVGDSESALRRLQTFGEFMSFMRSKPSKVKGAEDRAQRELPFRLIAQTVRLARCLAVVLGRNELDAEVMRRVRRACLDTSRGRVLECARRVRKAGEEGLSAGALGSWLGETDDRMRTFLRFMTRIGIVEPAAEKVNGTVARVRYRLTDRLVRLWEEVEHA